MFAPATSLGCSPRSYGMLAAARSYVFTSLEAQWKKLERDEPLTVEERADSWLSRTHAFQKGRDVVSLLYDTIGAGAIYSEKSSFDRHLRDLHRLSAPRQSDQRFGRHRAAVARRRAGFSVHLRDAKALASSKRRSDMGLPNGLHHLALNVHDVEGPLEFFTQVCGMEMVAFYWMHGVKDAYHIFLRLNGHSSVALVRDPADNEIEARPEQRGMFGMSRIRGAMQHVAFNVASVADLLAMRDRVPAHGYQTFGPIDHGFCRSVYIPGAPEHMMVEFSTSAQPIDPAQWIGPTTVEHAGLTPEQIERYRNPPTFRSRRGAVEQPAYDPERQILEPAETDLLSDPRKLAEFERMVQQPAE